MKKTITGIIGIAAIAALVGIACNDVGDSDSKGAKAFLDRYHGGEKPVEPDDSCNSNPKPGCANYCTAYPNAERCKTDTCTTDPKPDCPNYCTAYPNTEQCKTDTCTTDPKPNCPNYCTAYPNAEQCKTDTCTTDPKPDCPNYCTAYPNAEQCKTDTCTTAPKPDCPNYCTAYPNGTGCSKTYAITFNYNYSGSTETITNTDTDGKLASLPTPERDGFRFDGWFTDKDDGTKVTEDTPFSKNTAIYAHWTRMYTVKFNSQRDSTFVSKNVVYGDKVSVPETDPVLDGCTLDGWYKEVTCDNNTKWNFNNDDVTSNITLYAKWTFTNVNTTYRAVRIGAQTWMAENLNSTVSVGIDTCQDSARCAQYGRLYSWDAASKACPASWHLPDTTEWKTLISYVGDSAGIKLKSKASDWNSINEGYKGIDKYGFSALPGCSGSSPTVSFDNNCATTKKGTWWSATKKDDNSGTSSTNYYNYGMSANNHNSSRSDNVSTNLYSVRCVRN